MTGALAGHVTKHHPGTKFHVHLAGEIRKCEREDLDALEWFGEFTEHREIIIETFEAQERGEMLMLIADIAGFPVGQIWLDLIGRMDQEAGVIWAFRVFSILRGTGIGTRLIDAAEHEFVARGFTFAELAVEMDNAQARRFYERRGYHVFDSATNEFSYRTPSGHTVRRQQSEWQMRKRLEAE